MNESNGRRWVRIERFPDEHTVIGPPVMLRDIDWTVDALMASSFMKEWFRNRIIEHLEGGGTFECLSSTTQKPTSVYRLAKDEDIRELAASGQLEVAKGNQTAKSARQKAGNQLMFTIVPSSKKLDAKLEGLTKQARQIIELLRAVGQSEMNEKEVEVSLDGKIKTKQPVMRVFGFYKKTFVEQGFITTSGGEQPEIDDEEEDDE